MNLGSAQDREDVIEVFEGLSQQYTNTDDGVKAMRRPLVKSYMLETVPPQKTRPALADLFRRVNHRLVPVEGDSTMYKVQSNENQSFVGVVEQLLDRHPVYYTQEKSDYSDRLVRKLVEQNSALDHLWISGRVFEQLHQIVLETTPKHRYGKLVFQFTSIFENETQLPEDDAEAAESNDDDDPDTASDDDIFVPERRATKFSMVERLSEIEIKLPKLHHIHRPLYAISQLRMPARKDARVDAAVSPCQRRQQRHQLGRRGQDSGQSGNRNRANG